MIYKNSGMTLIEVLASVTLLSIIILTFSYVFIQSQMVTTRNGGRLTALQLAQKELSSCLTLEEGDYPENARTDVENTPEHPDNWVFLYLIENGADSSFKTYVFEDHPENSEGDPMYIVRTYYGEQSRFVELYNFKQN